MESEKLNPPIQRLKKQNKTKKCYFKNYCTHVFPKEENLRRFPTEI